jgi:hypothetical protein
MGSTFHPGGICADQEHRLQERQVSRARAGERLADRQAISLQQLSMASRAGKQIRLLISSFGIGCGIGLTGTHTASLFPLPCNMSLGSVP